jgi:hypothetical protein
MIAIKNYHPNGLLVPSLNADSFTLLVWLIKTSRLVMFVWKEILICFLQSKRHHDKETDDANTLDKVRRYQNQT